MSAVRFICPFCPLTGRSGDVEAVSEGTEADPGESYVTHSFPPCARFEAIDEDDPESFADFIADCRKKLAGNGAVMKDSKPTAVVLEDLVPELQRLFEGYLEAEPDGDRGTFASWVADEIPDLTHSIECECDCHANNAVWPGAHCKDCGGTCEFGEG